MVRLEGVAGNSNAPMVMLLTVWAPQQDMLHSVGWPTACFLSLLIIMYRLSCVAAQHQACVSSNSWCAPARFPAEPQSQVVHEVFGSQHCCLDPSTSRGRLCSLHASAPAGTASYLAVMTWKSGQRLVQTLCRRHTKSICWDPL